MNLLFVSRFAFLLAILMNPFSAISSEEVVKTKLVLNWKAEPEFGGFYEADSGKHFEKRGLKVEVLEGGAGTPVSQMVAAGKIDFGISSADEVLLARDRGGDVVALFAVYKTNPQGIMVHEAENFTAMKEVYVRPGNLSISAGMPYALFLKKKFEKEMKVTQVPYSGGVGNFLADKTFRQQCFVTSEPLAAKKNGAKPKTFLIADEGFNPYGTVLITRQSFLKKNPEIVKKMVASVRDGWKAYLKDPSLANARMTKINPSMDLETFNSISETQKPFIVLKGDKDSDLGKMDTMSWQKVSDALLDLKLISKKPDLKDVFINY
jgi:NitT/TauT family transport system substrate-binding protein